jgi:hypothetical protein
MSASGQMVVFRRMDKTAAIASNLPFEVEL